MKIRFENICFNPEESIENVLQKMTQHSIGFSMAINDDGRLAGVVTDGDIRRAFLNNRPISSPIRDIMNIRPKIYRYGLSIDTYRQLMLDDKKNFVPLVDKNSKVVDYLALEDVLNPQTDEPKDININGQETVLVTGGAGYIGSILCTKLLKEGYKVKVLDNLLFGSESIQNIQNNIDFELIVGDVRHIEKLDQAVFGVDRVIHLAAIVGDPACALDDTTTITYNHYPTKVLAELSKIYHVKQFVFASSCSVYGASGDDFLTEESQADPVSLYAETRLESEKLLMEMSDSSFSTTVLRLATVYGMSPRMRFDLVVNLLAAQASTKQEINIFGPSQWRPFVHAEDVAEAFVLSIKAPRQKTAGQTFNVGSSSENYTIGEVGDLVRDIIPGTKVNIREDITDLRSYRVNFDKIAETLDFRPIHSVPESINEIAKSCSSGHFVDYLDSHYSNFKTMEKVVFKHADVE